MNNIEHNDDDHHHGHNEKKNKSIFETLDRLKGFFINPNVRMYIIFLLI